MAENWDAPAGGSAMVLEDTGRDQRANPVLRGRAAFVSGASRGIGASIALALARAGAAVVVNYREQDRAAMEVCGRIAGADGMALPARADVRDPLQVARAMALAGERFGRALDIVINCAGGRAPLRALLEMAWADVQDALDVHVKGAWHCCQAALPGMMAQGAGWIVNIGSTVNWSAPPRNWSAYAVAKRALEELTRSLAQEAGPHGIRVNMVSPGFTEAGITLEMPKRARDIHAMRTPLGRLAEPMDVAEAVVFLCSPASDSITGVNVPVCGGAAM